MSPFSHSLGRSQSARWMIKTGHSGGLVRRPVSGDAANDRNNRAAPPGNMEADVQLSSSFYKTGGKQP
jgi:hypothetical protein